MALTGHFFGLSVDLRYFTNYIRCLSLDSELTHVHMYNKLIHVNVIPWLESLIVILKSAIMTMRLDLDVNRPLNLSCLAVTIRVRRSKISKEIGFC